MGACRILSMSDEPFADRADAGRRLAEALDSLRGRRAVVLGIPRGGMVVAREVARSLEADLDCVLARKLGAPDNPELAIGAIAEDGRLFLDERISGYLGVGKRYVEAEAARQKEVIAQRAAQYRAIRPKVALAGRIVVVTDDGIATGATMQAALWTSRNERPERLICAVPVGPSDTVERLAKSADETVCLRAPPAFGAVGRFYLVFDQTDESELTAILEAAAGPERGSS